LKEPHTTGLFVSKRCHHLLNNNCVAPNPGRCLAMKGSLNLYTA